MKRLRKKVLISFILLALCSIVAACTDDPNGTGQGRIIFKTTGSVFSPVITVDGTPEILWTWADGSTDNSAEPTKDYGSDDIRSNTLTVKPWSAVVRINIGYDGGDGGSFSIEPVADQHVSSVRGLKVVAPYLKQWCSSYNDITSLDFSNFTELDTIECFYSHTLQRVNLRNTPSLERACFEDCDLLGLDLSGSPNLTDLRGALNAYTSINFGTIGAYIWHICIRDNPQITSRNLFADMSQFPQIAELFIWNDNQTGPLVVPSTSLGGGVSIQAYNNSYTSADFTGALQNSGSLGTINIDDNNLTSLVITGCSELTTLSAKNNNLNSGAVDSVLAELDTLGRSGGIVDLSGNAAPSSDGLTHAASLFGKGWTVTVTP